MLAGVNDLDNQGTWTLSCKSVYITELMGELSTTHNGQARGLRTATQVWVVEWHLRMKIQNPPTAVFFRLSKTQMNFSSLNG